MNTVTLKHPFDLNGEKVKTIAMRRPKVKDQLAADKGTASSAEKEIKLFGNLCEVAPDVIQELDLADYRQLQEAYTGFLS